MSDDLVSVIIPVYNTGQSTVKLLDILKKNPQRNIEVILVDDGSTDKSRQIIKQHILASSSFNLVEFDFTKKLEKVQKIPKNLTKIQVILISQPNGGPSSARNTGINISSGEYLVFIDSDDEIKTNHLKELFDGIQKPGVELAVCGVKTIHMSTGKYFLESISKPKKQRKNESKTNYILRLLLADGRMYAVHNKIYRSDIIKKNHLLFDEKLDFAEDLKFNLTYLKYTSGDIKFILKPLYVYNYGTSTSVVQKSSLIKQNWQKSYDDLVYWATTLSGLAKNQHHKLPLSTKILLFKVKLRWTFSHIHNVFRFKPTFAERTKFLSPATVVIFTTVIRLLYFYRHCKRFLLRFLSAIKRQVVKRFGGLLKSKNED